MTVLAFIASALLELVGMVARPTVATCPVGSWLAEGVRPSGEYSCRFDPMSDDTDTAPREHPPRAVIGGRVWCLQGQQPRTDGARVWCSGGPTS